MIFIRKQTKTALKWIFVLILIAIIVYTFRDSAGPILEELKRTSVWIILGISILSVGYEMVEGWITCSFARHYNPRFTYRMGLESAFYCSFYRVATLGSGAGVAAVYYFNENGIPVSKGTGMYMVEYAIHKVGIAIFSAIFFVASRRFMLEHYGEYTWLLLGGYAVTFVIAAALILFCCSKRFHRLILWLADKLNRKGRFDGQLQYLKEQCEILESAAADLLGDKRFVAGVVCKNLLKFAFWYGIPYFVFLGTGKITIIQAMAVTSLSVMLAAVLPSPAGIGSTEFVFTMLFAAVTTTGAAGSTSLLYRFATFVLPFAIGAVIVILRRRRKRIC